MKRKLVLICLALSGASGAAQAGNCPRGQFYQVSKHACISRDDAIKLGLAHGAAHNAAKPETPPSDQPAPEASAPEPQTPQGEPEAAKALETPIPPQPRHVHAVKVAPPKAPPTSMEPAPTTMEPPPFKLEAAPATEAPAPQPRDSVSQDPQATGATTVATAPAQSQAAPAKASPFGALDPGNVPVMAPAK